MQRFWSKVRKTHSCWLWQGSLNNKGYGFFNPGDGRTSPVLAHRKAYELVRGAIPRGAVVMHTCDTPACVNPMHLKAGTQAENMQDAARKGRMGKARGVRNHNARLTPEIVREIRRERSRGVRCQDLADRFGVTTGRISEIANRHAWVHVE